MEAMTLQQLMARAIGKEQEAYFFYQSTAKIVNNPGAKQMLLELAEEEVKHKNRLESLDLSKIGSMKTGTIKDLGIERFLTETSVSPDMTPTEALQFAMKEEEDAHKFYTYLAESVNDPTVKTLAEALAREEIKHKVRLEKMWDEEIYKEN